MVTKNNQPLFTILVVLVALSITLSGCLPQPTATLPPPPTSTATPTLSPTVTKVPTILPTVTPTVTPTSVPFPVLALNPGENYFSIDGKPSFLLSRNITGKNQDDFDTLLEWAHQGGSKIIRVHLTHGWWGDPWINKDWSVNEKWAQDWDRFFDKAQADGIYVIPVFGVWADWNNGTPDWGSPLWQVQPVEFSQWRSGCFAGGFVRTDFSHPEPLDGMGQDSGEALAGTARTSPPGRSSQNSISPPARLVTWMPKAAWMKRPASISQTMPWPSSAPPIRNIARSPFPWREYIHPPANGPITTTWIRSTSSRFMPTAIRSTGISSSTSRKYLAKYQKPVLIGESGLWSMIQKPNAHIGIEHAIWADLVSGAMNGRALWDIDGYDIYASSNRADAMAFMQAYATQNGRSRISPTVSISPVSSRWSPHFPPAFGEPPSAAKAWCLAGTGMQAVNRRTGTFAKVISKQTVTITVPGYCYRLEN